MTNEGLPLALETIFGIMRDAKQPAGARVSAAKIVIDWHKQGQDGAETKDPSEMTATEISREIARLQTLRAAQATLVEVEELEHQPRGVFD